MSKFGWCSKNKMWWIEMGTDLQWFNTFDEAGKWANRYGIHIMRVDEGDRTEQYRGEQ
jgi:hypothetical protein